MSQVTTIDKLAEIKARHTPGAVVKFNYPYEVANIFQADAIYLLEELEKSQKDNERLRKNLRISDELLSKSQSKSSCLEDELKQTNRELTAAVEVHAMFLADLQEK